MPAKIQIDLSEEDQSFLQVYVHRGQAKARLLMRAYILLKAAEGSTDVELCETFQVCAETVRQVRKRFIAGGVAAALQDKMQKRRRHFCTQAVSS